MLITLISLSRSKSVSESFTWWASIFLLIVLPVCINGVIAREKGRSMIAGAFFGLIFSVIGTIILLVLPYASGRQAELDEGLNWFPRVRYILGGSTAYSGDLVITSSAIYFFPLSDTLETQRAIIGTAAGSVIAGFGGLAVGKTLGKEMGKSISSTFGTFSQRNTDNMPKEALSEQLDTYFEQNRTQFAMPAIRVLKGEISNLRYTTTGRLIFDVPKAFDNHDLKIDYLRASKLGAALKAEGYLL